MPFTLHFNSRENTELLNVSVLEELGKCNEAKKQIYSLVFDSHFNQPITKLPDFIKHIEFGNNFTEDISQIGDNIESIKFKVAEFNYNLAIFPKALIKLNIIADKITSRIENINPGLKTIIIQCSSFNNELYIENTNITSIKILSKSFDRTLAHLPYGLKSLEINCDRFNSHVDNLPSGLEWLKISSAIFNQPIDNLPHGLKTLILEGVDLFMQQINNLPHGLEIFSFNLGYNFDATGINIYKHSLANLPNTIRKCTIANYWGDLNTISNCDGIVELDIWFPSYKSREVRTYIQHWNKLPSSLKKLDINKELARINKIHNMVDIIKSNMNIKGICLNGVQM